MVKVYCFYGRDLPSLVGVVAVATTPQVLLRLGCKSGEIIHKEVTVRGYEGLGWKGRFDFGWSKPRG